MTDTANGARPDSQPAAPLSVEPVTPPGRAMVPEADLLEFVKPKTDSVAIIGSAHNTRDAAPDDPNWTRWGINENCRYIAGSWSANYNVHSIAELRKDYAESVRYMGTVTFPCWLHERIPEVPTSLAFPFDEMRRLYPWASFYSGVAWMFAHAITLGYKRIGLFGVEMMIHSEYGYQRNNMLEWIGFARGRGIEVVIPEASVLTPPQWFYGVVEPPNADGPIPHALLRDRQKAHLTNAAAHDIEAAKCRGRAEENALYLSMVEQYRRDNPGVPHKMVD